jgi:hypothetical protein
MDVIKALAKAALVAFVVWVIFAYVWHYHLQVNREIRDYDRIHHIRRYIGGGR